MHDAGFFDLAGGQGVCDGLVIVQRLQRGDAGGVVDLRNGLFMPAILAR
jgi:hypothetical protein